MSTPNKPSEQGFKPGANMQGGGSDPKLTRQADPQQNPEYDPKRDGMQPSGPHASGHPANDALSSHRHQQPDALRQPVPPGTDGQQGNENSGDPRNK
jgi:hypothetical protein